MNIEERVNTVYLHCTTGRESDAAEVIGIFNVNHNFNMAKLNGCKDPIADILSELDQRFFTDNGWSFADFILDKNRKPWTNSYALADSLFMMARTVNLADYYTTCRDHWKLLRKGMPYIWLKNYPIDIAV